MKVEDSKKTLQSGNKAQTIDQYIEAQDEAKREDLYLVYRTLKEVLPQAQEKMAWSMPTFWQGANIIHFKALKDFIGLYPGPEAIAVFEADLKDYEVLKRTIKIPYGKVDGDLLKRIASWCLEAYGK